MINRYQLFKRFAILATAVCSAYLISAEKTIPFNNRTPTFRPILPRLSQQPPSAFSVPHITQAPHTPSRVAIIRLSNVKKAESNTKVLRRPAYSYFTTIIVIGDTRQALSIEDYRTLFELFDNLGEVLYVPETAYNQLVSLAGDNKDVLAYLIRASIEKQ